MEELLLVTLGTSEEIQKVLSGLCLGNIRLPSRTFIAGQSGCLALLDNLGIKKTTTRAMGSLVVRASDSTSEGLSSMPEATKYPPSTHGFNAEIAEGEIGGVAIYRRFGEFRRAKSYCHLYGAQGKRLSYF
ncbi:hypothetical protein TNCV_3616861 [Trichonephila clavipes]|nr:hypothetical protein TNCV_3616861 [Trichonephila clavipes]